MALTAQRSLGFVKIAAVIKYFSPSLVYSVSFTVRPDKFFGNGYRWDASAATPDAFQTNLLTAGIPQEHPFTCRKPASYKQLCRVLRRPHGASNKEGLQIKTLSDGAETLRLRRRPLD